MEEEIKLYLSLCVSNSFLLLLVVRPGAPSNDAIHFGRELRDGPVTRSRRSLPEPGDKKPSAFSPGNGHCFFSFDKVAMHLILIRSKKATSSNALVTIVAMHLLLLAMPLKQGDFGKVRRPSACDSWCFLRQSGRSEEGCVSRVGSWS